MGFSQIKKIFLYTKNRLSSTKIDNFRAKKLYEQNADFKNTLPATVHWVTPFTQGVLDSKFPISIRTQTQGQYRCQNFRKILKIHVPVSDFATMLLNLRKTQKSQKF